jgi:hypothetical protein
MMNSSKSILKVKERPFSEKIDKVMSLVLG